MSDFNSGELVQNFSGILVAVNWDNKGTPLNLHLNTEGEKSYPIFMDGLGKTLIKFTSSVIELEAELVARNEETYLKVRRFKIVEY